VSNLLVEIEKSIFDLNMSDASMLKSMFLMITILIVLLISIGISDIFQSSGFVAVYEEVGLTIIVPLVLLFFIFLLNRNLSRLSLVSVKDSAKVDMHNAVSNMSMCLIATLFIGIGIGSSVTTHITEIIANEAKLMDYNIYALAESVIIFIVLQLKYIKEKKKTDLLKENHPNVRWN